MKTLSSYQKLKLEIENLNQDIYNLVRKSDTEEGIITKIKYEWIYNVEDDIWSGDTSHNNTFQGIFETKKVVGKITLNEIP